MDADFNPFYNQEEVIASLQAEHDFGSLTLTALGGYRWRKFDQARDFDMGYAPNAFIPGTYGTGANAYTIPDAGDGNGVLTYLLYAGRQVTSKDYMSAQTSGGNAEQYSGELRVASDYEGKFNFLAGAYYLSSRQSNNVYPYVPSGRLRGAASAANTPRAAVDSYAVFGEVYYDITPELQVLAGFRYTKDGSRPGSAAGPPEPPPLPGGVCAGRYDGAPRGGGAAREARPGDPAAGHSPPRLTPREPYGSPAIQARPMARAAVA